MCVVGIQLHLTGGGVSQGIQISGLDASLLAQPVQIDSNLLQQLQQGNVNISVNSGNNMYTQGMQAADPNLVQNIQVSGTIYFTFYPINIHCYPILFSPMLFH